MSVFSEKELDYLAGQRLGRLATIDGDGVPHVVPLGWSYNPALDTIDVGGRDFARTKKFRNARHNPKVALVIDDVLPPWRPRCIMVRGMAEALTEAMGADGQPTGPINRLPAQADDRASALRSRTSVLLVSQRDRPEDPCWSRQMRVLVWRCRSYGC